MFLGGSKGSDNESEGCTRLQTASDDEKSGAIPTAVAKHFFFGNIFGVSA